MFLMTEHNFSYVTILPFFVWEVAKLELHWSQETGTIEISSNLHLTKK